MSEKIYGIPITTPFNPQKFGAVKTVNGASPDENGNIDIEVNDGKDGVSCTHSWDGTVLNVTSASGTSSADLKGEKGDTGESGITSPVAGFFTLSVDADGDLWVYSEDDNVPEFEYDSETGYLYVVQEVDV